MPQQELNLYATQTQTCMRRWCRQVLSFIRAFCPRAQKPTLDDALAGSLCNKEIHRSSGSTRRHREGEGGGREGERDDEEQASESGLSSISTSALSSLEREAGSGDEGKRGGGTCDSSGAGGGGGHAVGGNGGGGKRVGLVVCVAQSSSLV